MRTLFLIRHAKSSWGNPGLRDFDRPLNERGLHDAPKMAKFLSNQGQKPELIISSPAKRAITTALFFAEAFNINPAEVQREPKIYEAIPQEILKIISALPSELKSVALFGHNPTFTEVANHFASTTDFIENVPTCGIVMLNSTADRWSAVYEGNTKITACYFPKEVL